MSTTLIVPVLSQPAMLAEWYLPDGARVRPGDALFRIECDGVAIEVDAEIDGALSQCLAAGAVAPEGTVIARLWPLDDPGSEDAVSSFLGRGPGRPSAHADEQRDAAPVYPHEERGSRETSEEDPEDPGGRIDPAAPVLTFAAGYSLPVAESAFPALAAAPQGLFLRTRVASVRLREMLCELEAAWGGGVQADVADAMAFAAARAWAEVGLGEESIAIRRFDRAADSFLSLLAAKGGFRSFVLSAGRVSEDAAIACAVTSLEKYGIEESFPVLLPGMSLALTVGALQPWDGELPGETYTVCLAYDGASIPEAAAVRFLALIRDLLESPYVLLAG